MRGEPTLAAVRRLTADLSASLRSTRLFEHKSINGFRLAPSLDTLARHSGNFPLSVADAKFAL